MPIIVCKHKTHTSFMDKTKGVTPPLLPKQKQKSLMIFIFIFLNYLIIAASVTQLSEYHQCQGAYPQQEYQELPTQLPLSISQVHSTPDKLR